MQDRTIGYLELLIAVCEQSEHIVTVNNAIASQKLAMHGMIESASCDIRLKPTDKGWSSYFAMQKAYDNPIPPIDVLLRATQISGVFIEMEEQLTVDRRGHLLTEFERNLLPELEKYQQLPYVRRILKEYNRNIDMNFLNDNRHADI